MPNWCENRLTVSADEDYELIAAFQAAVAGPAGPLDFNSILPMPEILEKVAEGQATFDRDGEAVTVSRWHQQYGADGKPTVARLLTAAEEAQLAELDYPTAFRWRAAMWGTAQDADHVEVDPDPCCSVVTFRFYTAWNPPRGIVEALRERFPDLGISAFYDEPAMEVAGYY